jgi:hypothetical protein
VHVVGQHTHLEELKAENVEHADEADGLLLGHDRLVDVRNEPVEQAAIQRLAHGVAVVLGLCVRGKRYQRLGPWVCA